MDERNDAQRVQLTRFLNELAQGRSEVAERLMPHVEDQLRQLARVAMNGQAAHHTLQPTALVNEAFLRLFPGADGEPGPGWNDRQHFFALAAKIMRQVLVDHARRQGRQKRGGGQLRVTLAEQLAEADEPEVELLDLDDALRELSTVDERQGRIVELRFFGGLSVAEVADLLSVSLSTVEREWRLARAWIGLRLEGRSG